MDFYWQVTVGELLLTIAVFAIAVTAYGPVASCVAARGRTARGIGTGLLFGIATAAALIMPVHLNAVDASGAQTALLALAGPLGGPLAALIAALAAACTSLFMSGGTLDPALPTVLVIGATALSGAILGRHAGREARIIHYWQLPLLGLPGALASIASACIFRVAPALAVGSDASLAMWQLALATSLSAMSATALLGTLLIREDRRLRVEAELRASEMRYRLLADNATDVILRFGRDLRLSYLSPAAVDVLGCTPESLLGLSPACLVHPDEQDAMAEAFAALKSVGRATITHRLPPRDRRDEIWLETSLRLVTGADDEAEGLVESVPGEIVGVLREVTARRMAEEAVRQANERLAAQAIQISAARDAAEASSRAKSEFLAAMSHELRTPLNAVIGFSEIINMQLFGPVGNPTYVNYAADIHYSGTHLLELITDILDFSKAEANELLLHDDDVDIAVAITQSLRLVDTRALRGQIRLDTAVQADLPHLRGDERRIRQIVINLLTNAIKFTPGSGAVMVAAAINHEGGLDLRVADTGIGIAAEDLEKVMEPFRQADGHLTRTQEGTGLGLPLTKRLVELHGGTLTIASTKGEGTCVTVTFPANRVVPAPQEAQHASALRA